MPSNALSAAQVAAYRKHGFHLPIRVMSPEEAAERVEWLERVERDAPDDFKRCDLKGEMLVPWIDELVRRPSLTEPIASILGEDLLNWNASFRIKRPDGRHHAGWHQDTKYIDIRPTGVIAFIALTPCTAKSGCVRAIPASQLGPMLEHQDTENADSILTRGQYITDPIDVEKAQDLEIQPGEAVLFDHHVVHGSGPNSAGFRRIAMLLGYFSPVSRPVNGARMSGTVVRGRDVTGNWRTDPRPTAEFGAEERAAHRAAVEAQTKELLYAGSARRPVALAEA